MENQGQLACAMAPLVESMLNTGHGDGHLAQCGIGAVHAQVAGA